MAPAEEVVDPAVVSEQRKAVLGEPLSEDEIAELVERYRHSDCSRQINLGKFLLAIAFRCLVAQNIGGVALCYFMIWWFWGRVSFPAFY